MSTTDSNVANASAPAMAKSVPMVVVVVVIATALTIGVAAGGIALVDRPDLYKPLVAASIATALASILSLVPIVWGLRGSVMNAAIGYFVATGVRLGVSLGASLLAVLVGKYPMAPTLLLMVAMYVVVLVVETAVIARVAWTASAPVKSGQETK